MLAFTIMRDTLINKYKIQLVIYIKELFNSFPNLMCLDFYIKNNIKTDIISGQHVDDFLVYFSAFLDLNSYNSLLHLNSSGSFLGIENVQLKDETIKVFNWELISEALEIHNRDVKIQLEDITKTHKYEFNKFNKKYLNLDVLRSEDFVQKLYRDYQFINPLEKHYFFRFVRNEEHYYKNFLGEEVYSLYEKSCLEGGVEKKEMFSTLELFKI